MGYVLFFGILLTVFFLPAILGAIARLACRKTHVDSLSIAIGVLLAILQAAFVSEKSGVLFQIQAMQEHNFSTGAINAMVVLCIVIQIGFYAAFASLGIKLTDKLRGSQQRDPQVFSEGAPSD